jgi:hypothetical protein
MVKTFITLAHGGKIKYPVIYSRVLTLDNVGTAVNYCGIFITLAPGDCIIINFALILDWKYYFYKH